MNKNLVRLVKTLAQLYPDIASSRFLMAELGINSGRIDPEQPPNPRWFFIVDESEKSGLIIPLIEIALSDYPTNVDLMAIQVLLLPVVAVPEYDLSKAIPPTKTDDLLDRILGGRLTKAFPDCVAVGSQQGYFCTGTLIAPDLVVTAKHCAAESIDQVFLNGYDLSDLSSGEIVAVASKRLHPMADIMLLTLAQNSTVTPRPLATDEGLRLFVPMTCTLVGFGTTDFDGTVGYGVKRRVEVPITTLACGGSEDSADFGCVEGREMVAGHRGLNRDSCRGDSGGPLYVQDNKGEFLLLGVTSRGMEGNRMCGDGGIYTRIDKFADWIL